MLARIRVFVHFWINVFYKIDQNNQKLHKIFVSARHLSQQDTCGNKTLVTAGHLSQQEDVCESRKLSC